MKDSDISDKNSKNAVQNIEFVEKITNEEILGINPGNKDFWVDIDFSKEHITTMKKAKLINSALRNIERITDLDIKFIDLDLKQVELLAQILKDNANIKYLRFFAGKFSVAGIKALTNVLIENKTITEIEFERMNMRGKEKSKALAEMIKSIPCLTSLIFSSNKLGEKDILNIADALKTRDDLIKFVLSGDFYDTRLVYEGCKAIAEALEVHSNLTELNFDETCMGSSPATIEMLKKLPKLNTLILTYNNMDDNNARSIVEVLKDHSNMTKLYLDGNLITDSGAIAIVEMLKPNSNITELYIASENITDEGAIAVIKLLNPHSNIVKLNLSSDRITDEGAIAIAEMLKSDSAISELDLLSSNITSKGDAALVKMLESNSTITELHFSNYILSEELTENVRISEKINLLLKKVCALDSETLYSAIEFNSNEQNMLEFKLMIVLPQLLLRLTNEQIFKFNSGTQGPKRDFSFNKFKECLINLTGNEALINNIFDEYAKHTESISLFIRTLCSYTKNGSELLLEKMKELEELNEWEIISSEIKSKEAKDLKFHGTMLLHNNLSDFFKNKPLSMITSFLKLHEKMEPIKLVNGKEDKYTIKPKTSEGEVNLLLKMVENHEELKDIITFIISEESGEGPSVSSDKDKEEVLCIDSLFEKICALDVNTLSQSNKFNDDEQDLLQSELSTGLPELLLKLTGEQIVRFNEKLKKTDSTENIDQYFNFNEFKKCLTNLTGNEDLINSIFDEYAKHTESILCFINTLCMSRNIRETFFEKIKNSTPNITKGKIGNSPNVDYEQIGNFVVEKSVTFGKDLDMLLAIAKDCNGLKDFIINVANGGSGKLADFNYEEIKDFFKDKPLTIITPFLKLSIRMIELSNAKELIILKEEAVQLLKIVQFQSELRDIITDITGVKLEELTNDESYKGKEEASDDSQVQYNKNEVNTPKTVWDDELFNQIFDESADVNSIGKCSFDDN